MYCPECGNKLEDDMRFCPECGTPVEREDTATQTANDETEDNEKGEYFASCIILTNIPLLSEALKTTPEEIGKLLKQFIEIKKGSGILYTLIDAGNYTYYKSSFFSRTKRVSLNLESSLWEYMDILMDVYKHQKTEPQYLFIIGGDNVIPMPCVKHYIANDKHDDSIDTDILYSYPYGSSMLPLLENQEIFKQEQLFHVGRLPFGNDSTIDDLHSYLQRDIECTMGVQLTRTYGQCDPNWKNVSVKVANRILPAMRNLDGRLADEYYYNRIILSPMVDDGNVAQVFDKESSLYYYNLHGGKALQIRGYAGAPRGEQRTRMVLQPEHMRTAQNPNIVVCEACYGARFINLDKHHSMMLSSIHNNTMVFLGSSRVAWGCVDQASTTPKNAHIGNADIIASAFISALLEGYSTGQALFIARSKVLQSGKPGNLLSALTIVEFNLYGDPTLFIATDGNKSLNYKKVGSTTYIDRSSQIQCTVEEVRDSKEENTGSILSLVRSAVNSNIAQMHNTIGKELYEKFGLTPRPAESVFKVRYSDGSEEYNFKYKSNDPESEIDTYYLVTTNSDGKITEINSSK